MLSLPHILLPPLTHIGLAFSKADIRAVELDSHGNVIKKAEIELPGGLFADGTIHDPYKLVMAIKQLLKEGKFNSKYATVCFPESLTFIRGYTLPVIPYEEVTEAISWHAKNVFPYPLKEIYFDWKLINNKGNELNISIVAIQKKVIDALIGTMISADIFPLRLSPDASATAKLLQLQANEYAVLIELNRTGAYVTLVEGEKSVFTTVVSYLVDEGVENYAKQIVATHADVLKFYEKKGVGVNTETEVVFTGEMATPDWISYLTTLGKFRSRLLKTQIDNPAFHKAYAAAILEPVAPIDEQTINLLPLALQNKFETERLERYMEALLIRLGVIIGVLSIVSLGLFVFVSMEKQYLEKRAKDLNVLVTKQEGSTQQLLRLNAQAKAVLQLAPLRKTPRDKLAAIIRIIGNDIQITQWEYDDQKLRFTLVGVAKTRDLLVDLKEKIEESPEFGLVNVPLESFTSATNVNFTMTFVSK